MCIAKKELEEKIKNYSILMRKIEKEINSFKKAEMIEHIKKHNARRA